MLNDIFIKLIGNAIVQAGRAIKVHNLEMFANKNFSITPEQFLVLSMLNDDAELYQNKLCEELYKDKSNMARILSVLGKKGLIEKCQTTENKKQVNKIKITPKGKQVRDEITPIMKNSREHYLDGVTQDEMYTCLKVLSKIQENLAKKE